MSLLAVQGGATGTGTVTLLAPVTNTNQTLTLPDATGTVVTTATAGVPVNGPAFSAYQSSSQTLTSSTLTKIQFQTEEYDTNSAFDNATNYRFTPLVAGYYVVSAAVKADTLNTTGRINIFKNGSSYKFGMATGGVAGTTGTFAMTCQVYLNGSTDYIECYALLANGQALSAASDQTYFQAAMVRSAV
jgi:hypothetical protein